MVTYRKKHYWNCTTFQTKGKSECAAKRIPEETLEVLTCEVLGAVSFDPDMVRSKIMAIRAEKNNVVVYSAWTTVLKSLNDGKIAPEQKAGRLK